MSSHRKCGAWVLSGFSGNSNVKCWTCRESTCGEHGPGANDAEGGNDESEEQHIAGYGTMQLVNTK